MILNQNVEFSHLPMDHQMAFLNKNGASPEKVLLKPGIKLYKFNSDTNVSFTDRGTGKPAMSQWWSPYDAYRHDGGWQNKVSIARHFGISVREWGRLTSAVKEDWNSLAYLLVIVTKDPVWGFFGGFASMDRNTITERDASGNATGWAAAKARPKGEGRGAGSIRLPGGGTQFYIPNLTPDLVYASEVISLANM